ncbi:MAG: polymer-forming cytoskeletal protein [Gammaproteobacteria bacterium]|nr:polymer-forming cytoskeletal protein [Pseudomonadales bacterium]MCP5347067.1 polymer-forming cytoskeletal protein [Pseudomonadales bacterium]
MFGSGEKTESLGPAHTLISRATEIVGDVHFSGELIVEGKIKGNIFAAEDSDALIRVVDQGAVEGEICVPSVVINGLVQGDVRSTKHVELAAKAVVVGNVYYNLIEMVMGSEVNGNLMHISAADAAPKQLTDASTGAPESPRVPEKQALEKGA